jgi:hypothetical protein
MAEGVAERSPPNGSTWTSMTRPGRSCWRCRIFRRHRPQDQSLAPHSDTDLSCLARAINAQVRGWITYYGAFCRSEFFPRLAHRRAHSSLGHAKIQND